MSHDPWLGRVLSGVRLRRLLGQGGMGRAYVGERGDESLVVKVLEADPDQVLLLARLQREAEALGKLPSHPALVRLVSAAIESDPPHLVMEWVPGKSLHACVQELGRLPAQDVARIGLDLARGLEVVHASALLHRDLKPANVMLTPGGAAKLIDFGLAKDLFRTTLTQPDALLGTWSFMAPETIDQPADVRADVFGLGATLFMALSGRPPYLAESLPELADLMRQEEPPLLRTLVPEAPESLELALARMLARQPDRRHESARACALDLEAVLGGERARTPGFVCPQTGARWDLAGRERSTLGSAPDCEVQVAEAAPRHAQVRRRRGGFELIDLRSAEGTWVEDRRVRRPVLLVDGQRVRLGPRELCFAHPHARPRLAPHERNVERAVVPEVLLTWLLQRGDPRAMLELVERSLPDPEEEARALEQLRPVLDPASVEATLACLRDLLRQERERVRRLLTQRYGFPPDDAARWWLKHLTAAPPQAVGRRLERSYRLHGPGVGPGGLSLTPDALVRVGSSPRCTLQAAGLERLHATLLLLHERALLVPQRGSVQRGGRPGGGPLQSGPFHLGDLAYTCVLSWASPVQAQGAQATSVVCARALATVKHPSSQLALLSLLEDRLRGAEALERAWSDCEFLGAPPPRAEVEELLEARARWAEERLREQLGEAPAQRAHPDEWRRALARRPLATQFVPPAWAGADPQSGD